MLTGLRLFEIAVFLFYRYFGSITQQPLQPQRQPSPPTTTTNQPRSNPHTTTTLTTTPTIATNYNHEPTTLKPSPQQPPPSSPLPALTNAVLHGPRGDDFCGGNRPRTHAGLPEHKLLRSLRGLFPPDFSRLFFPALWSGGRAMQVKGQRSCKGGVSFWGNNSWP